MEKIRAIAIYLPQFHRVPENDEWWGEGFTEWVAVKKAKPLFNGHNQPRIPLNDNWYNLMDKKTMEWQSQLAQKYGIGGFAFYHYWFENGRRILEKPAENLLKWKDIDMPFCFSWANESWIRTWSNVKGGNAWAGIYEGKENSKKDDGILLKQSYGRERAWKEHFDYLLPFFVDKRYIKIDGKPVFLIYKPGSVPCLNQMIRYWNRMAINNGLPGVYMIGVNYTKSPYSALDATMEQEPGMYFSKAYTMPEVWHWLGSTKGVEYEKLWEDVFSRNHRAGEKVFLGGVVDYDSTPRHAGRGDLLLGVTPEKFKENFRLLVEKSIEMNNELVFINAWNEWGEGMYLEPDKKNGFQYLEAVKEVMGKYGAR